MLRTKLKSAVVVAALLLPAAALAGGSFLGWPLATSNTSSWPLTGNETIPADTNLTQGIMPQTELITTGMLATYAAGYNTSFRNALICGDFGTCPWTRGTSGFGDIANTLTYGADRWWNLGGASSAINVTQQTGASDVFAGTSATLRFQRKSGNANTTAICTGQVLESATSYPFQGKTAVFSFTAKIGANFSAANNYVVATIAYGTGTDGTSANFAAGSWTGYTAATATNVALTTTLTRYTVAAAIPSTANQVGIKLCYTPVGTASTNDWFEMGQVQLEASSQSASTAVASIFEYVPPPVVGLRANRFAWALTEPAADVCQGAGYSTATTAARVIIANPVTMRAAPTVTSIGASLANTTWKVQDAATPIVLSTPYLATYTANTVGNITLTATTGASQTVGRGVLLCGAGGGGKLLVSADL